MRTEPRSRLFALAFAGAMVVLVILIAAKTAAGSSYNPITTLRTTQLQENKLLVRGPAGWNLIRDVDRFQYLERQQARAWYVITWTRYWAIQYVFGPYAAQAWAVSNCEGTSIWSHNGQYLGIFQMGSHERQLYGHGSTYLAQARAGYRYFVASGRDWSPWQCKP